MKHLMFYFVASIMVSGLLLGSMGPSVSATVAEDNPGKAKGCENANQEKSKVKDKNPHCETTTECPEFVLWYHDHDQDGYGDEAESTLACIDGSDLPDPPTGAIWSINGDDCNDNDPLVNPGEGNC